MHAIISPFTILLTCSKSKISKVVLFTKISFTIIVHIEFAKFCAVLFSSHISARLGVIGSGIKCPKFKAVIVWSKIPLILGQKNKQWRGVSFIQIFAYLRQYSQELLVTPFCGYLQSWSQNCAFLYNKH